MLGIRIIIMIVCAGLFFWGGYNFKPARRFIMPFIIAISCAWLSHSWWVLTGLSAMALFSLGYGDSSILRRIFNNGWGRSVYGLLGALALSLGLLCTGHIAWYYFIGYLALNFTLENALKNIPQKIGDPIIGLGFSLILILVN